jgi:hypothetical protein
MVELGNPSAFLINLKAKLEGPSVKIKKIRTLQNPCKK